MAAELPVIDLQESQVQLMFRAEQYGSQVQHTLALVINECDHLTNTERTLGRIDIV